MTAVLTRCSASPAQVGCSSWEWQLAACASAWAAWHTLFLVASGCRPLAGATSLNGGLRLRGGTSEREGLIELNLSGADGLMMGAAPRTVAIVLDRAVAQIVCRDLGFGGGAVRDDFWYGGLGVYMASILACTGSEASLSECSWEEDHALMTVTGVACNGELTLSICCRCRGLVGTPAVTPAQVTPAQTH